jgi:hypothetical protein
MDDNLCLLLNETISSNISVVLYLETNTDPKNNRSALPSDFIYDDGL